MAQAIQPPAEAHYVRGNAAPSRASCAERQRGGAGEGSGLMDDFTGPLRATIRLQSHLVSLAELARDGRLSRNNAELTLRQMRKELAAFSAWLEDIERRLQGGDE